MTEQVVEQRRPFHEAIVDALRRAADGPELAVLGNLIKATTIPKNHDEIIEAWKQRAKFVWWDHGNLGVLADLLEQKQEAEKEEEKKKAKEQAITNFLVNAE